MSWKLEQTINDKMTKINEGIMMQIFKMGEMPLVMGNY